MPNKTTTSKRSNSILAREAIPTIVAKIGAPNPQLAKLLTKRRRGQALSEYLILTSLVAVGSIAVVQVLGSNLQSRLGMVAAALGGEKKQIAAKRVKEEQYEVRDLGDFNSALQDNSESRSGGNQDGNRDR